MKELDQGWLKQTVRGVKEYFIGIMRARKAVYHQSIVNKQDSTDVCCQVIQMVFPLFTTHEVFQNGRDTLFTTAHSEFNEESY